MSIYCPLNFSFYAFFFAKDFLLKYIFIYFSLKDKEAELEILSKQKSELNNQLEQTKKSAETAVTTATAPAPASALGADKLKELEDALAERDEKNKILEESVETMKKKNNVS